MNELVGIVYDKVVDKEVGRIELAGKGAGVDPVSSSALQFRLLPWEMVPWVELEQYPDRCLFQSQAWLQFVARTQGGQPRVAALVRGNETVGYFTLVVVNRAGLRIAGSPFKGWTTSAMGFNTRDEAVRDEAIRGAGAFVFRELGCAHLEVLDRQIDLERAKRLGLAFTSSRTYEIDLRASEDELLAQMQPSARRYVRRASKQRNITIEICQEPEFADDYHEQLREVFARQGLTPTYGVERVRALMDCLLPTGNLLLLRARDRAGRCVATGIYPARNGTMYFWGGASRCDSLLEHPNEPLHWHAMTYWKQRGMLCYDLGGGGEYKEKYGGAFRERPCFRQSRYRAIGWLRDLASSLQRLRRQLKGWCGHRYRPVTA